MAPAELPTHSCRHCSRIVFDPRKDGKAPEDEQQRDSLTSPGIRANGGMVFEFLVSDLTAGDLDGCTLCSWTLDDDLIHRSQLAHKMSEAVPIDSPSYKATEAIRDAIMVIDCYLGPPEPAHTLRRDALYQSGHLDLYILYASAPKVPKVPFDFLRVTLFGLWDPQTQSSCIEPGLGLRFSRFRVSHRVGISRASRK